MSRDMYFAQALPSEIHCREAVKEGTRISLIKEPIVLDIDDCYYGKSARVAKKLNLIWQKPKEADSEIERWLYRIMAEKGLQKTFREIKSFDRIEDSKDDHWNTAEAKEARDKEPWFHILPFIQEGVIKEGAGERASIWIYFRVENVDKEAHSMGVYMELYSFQRKVKIFSCVGKSRLTYHAAQTVGDCRFSVDALESGRDLLCALRIQDDQEFFLRAEEREVLDYRISAWKEEAVRASYVEAANLFLQLIEHLNILMAKAPVEECGANMAQQKDGKDSKSSQRKDLGKEKKTKIIYLGGVRVIPAAQGSQIKVKKKRIINRYTETWGVRGHLRHYKNGKVVMVRPYEKGPGRQKENQSQQQRIFRSKIAGK